MKSDVDKISFSAVANGGTIADVDVSDVYQVAFAIDIDTITGAPTNLRAIAVPLDDQVLGSITEHLRKTVDVTAIGVFLLGNRGTTVFEPAIENTSKKIRVFADFTAGTAPTITGSLYIMKKRVS